MLSYIPDPIDYTPRHGTDATGWEGFLLDKANRGQPFSTSIGTSNLGLCPVLPVDVNQVTFAQRDSGFGTAINVSVFGESDWRIIDLLVVEGGCGC
jgi:hypothetical protein